MYAPNYPFTSQHNPPPSNPNPANQQQLTPQQRAYLQQQQQLRQTQSQSPHISQQQQQQQMMFNQAQSATQYAGGAQTQMGYGGAMGAGINTGAMQNPALGMGMQSPAVMAHGHSPAGAQQPGMAGVSASSSYQTPYTASPYATQTPISAPTNSSQGHFIPPTTSASQFSTPQRMSAPPMNAAQQRNSPFPGQHTSPANSQQPFQPPGHSAQNSMSMPSPAMMAQAQAQQQTQGMMQNQGQNQNQNGQQSGNQTPITLSGAGGAGQGQAQNSAQNNAPLSPGGESREKERVSLLLDINKYLLMEVMKLQDAQQAAKAAKEAADGKQEGEKLKIPVDPGMGKEFVECMRRIQYNLSYLAAIADRSHKPSSQTPPHPAIISAPQLESIKRMKAAKKEETRTLKSEDEKKDDAEEEEEEDGPEELKKMYARLQTLFPGVDPRKEPPVPQQGGMKPQQPQNQQASQPPSSQAQTGGLPAQQTSAQPPNSHAQNTPGQSAINGVAASHSTPAGPGTSGFGQGSLTTTPLMGNTSTPQSIQGSTPNMSSMTPEQRMTMMQQMQSRQQGPQLQAQMMQAPNRDFNASGANMGFGSGAMNNANPNHIGLGGGSMGAGPGGGGGQQMGGIGLPPTSTGGMGGGGGPGGLGGAPAGAGGSTGIMSMASNESRARMMAQMQAQMQGMTPQQRMEVMKNMGVSAGVIGAVGGGHLRQQSQGQQGGMQGMGGGGQQGGMGGGGNMGGQQGMGMGGGMYRQ